MALGAVSCGSQEAKLGLDQAQVYSSIPELTAASTAVVMFKAQPRPEVAWVGGIPFTVTTVQVERVLAGAVSAAVLEIQQTGAVGHATSAEITLLVPGETYVGFITPLTYGASRPATGYYVVVGLMQGLYRVVGAHLQALDTNPNPLPATLTLTGLSQSLSVSRTASPQP